MVYFYTVLVVVYKYQYLVRLPSFFYNFFLLIFSCGNNTISLMRWFIKAIEHFIFLYVLYEKKLSTLLTCFTKNVVNFQINKSQKMLTSVFGY
jgi:hypothetical protein